MAITTNGKLQTLLRKAIPNAKIVLVVNGQTHDIARLRYKSESHIVELHGQAMSDEELFAEVDGEAILNSLQEEEEEEDI